MAEHLPDGTVLDGEILPWRDGAVLPFAQLQRRIGRKDLGAAMLAAVPVVPTSAGRFSEDTGLPIRPRYPGSPTDGAVTPRV
jgi:DNA ligase-1